MAIEGILFDKDGTLIDYFATWMPVNREVARAVAGGEEALVERLLIEVGYRPDEDAPAPGSVLAAGTAADLAAAWLPFLPGRHARELAEEIDAIFVAGGRRHAVAVEGLERVVAALSVRGYALGIATSDSLAGLHASLAHFGVLGHFAFLSGYDSGHGVKPDPGQVRAFCAATGLGPAAVAVVGDNPHDLAMGRAAGAGLVVGVLTGTGRRADLAGEADHVLPSIAELEALLEEIER